MKRMLVGIFGGMLCAGSHGSTEEQTTAAYDSFDRTVFETPLFRSQIHFPPSANGAGRLYADSGYCWYAPKERVCPTYPYACGNVNDEINARTSCEKSHGTCGARRGSAMSAC